MVDPHRQRLVRQLEAQLHVVPHQPAEQQAAATAIAQTGVGEIECCGSQGWFSATKNTIRCAAGQYGCYCLRAEPCCDARHEFEVRIHAMIEFLQAEYRTQVEELERGRIGLMEIDPRHADYMPVNQYNTLRAGLPDAELVFTKYFLHELVVIHSAEELDCVRKAGVLCEKAMEAMVARAKPGVKEYELRAAAGAAIMDGGGDIDFLRDLRKGDAIQIEQQLLKHSVVIDAAFRRIRDCRKSRARIDPVLEVLGGAALPVRQCLQLFRALIQPAPRARLGLTVTQDDAEASVHAVRTLLKRLPAIERDQAGGS